MAKKKKGMDMCCMGVPILSWLILILAALWFIADMEWIALDFPWLSAIVLLFSIYMIKKHYYYSMMK